MNENLRKQMEEMAYAHAGMQSPSAEMRPYYERAYTEGFTACSEIYEKELATLKEENRKLRRGNESRSCNS